MRKKAVSPLIATVLLIAFAVALGAVVMNWAAKGPVETDSRECANVKLSLEVIDGEPKICSILEDKNVLEFVLSNDANKDISSLRLSIITKEGDPYNYVINEAIMPSNTKKIVHFFNERTSGISKVKITPVVFSGEEEICTGKSIEAINIKEC